MFIVIYRQHNKLNCETQHFGPFTDHDSAYDFHCTLPALGIYRDDGELNNPGVKYIEPLITCPPYTCLADREVTVPGYEVV